MGIFGKLDQGVKLTEKVSGYLTWIPQLVTRVVVGAGFYMTGSGKIANIDKVIGYFGSLHIPFPQIQAPFVARLEYYGGICLVLGLFTRPIAFLLAGSMTVALMTADSSDIAKAFSMIFGQNVGDWDKVPTDVTSFAYLLLLAWLTLYGAGAVSIDKLLNFFMRKQAATESPAEVQTPE